MRKRIGVFVLATNAYFVLGLRFIKRFEHFYQGDSEIVFYFFSDEDPTPYVPDYLNVKYYNQKHTSWTEGTNSRYKNIANIQYDLRKQVDYLFFFDADTSVDKPFTEEWFLYDSVALEHYGNRDWLSDGSGFSRNPAYKDFISPSTRLDSIYRHGCFFGGSTENMITLCETLYTYQIIDGDKGYSPGNNDEGYLNAYFHYHTPVRTIPTDEFQFVFSDKGGLDEIVRLPNVSIDHYKRDLLKNKNVLFDIKNQMLSYERF